MKRSIPILVMGIAGLAFGSSSVACTAIASVPVQITQSGSYCVTRNLVFNGPGVAIAIAANNVSIDLGGYSLVQAPLPQPYTSIGVNGIEVQSVTVSNGRLRGFKYGVNLQAPRLADGNFVVSALTIRSAYEGIIVIGGNSTISDNVISDTNDAFDPSEGSAHGIDASSHGTPIHIINNRIDNTRSGTENDWGIVHRDAPGSVVSDNIITDVRHGIDVECGYTARDISCGLTQILRNRVFNTTSIPGVGVRILGNPDVLTSVAALQFNDIENFWIGVQFVTSTGYYRNTTVSGPIAAFDGGVDKGKNYIERF